MADEGVTVFRFAKGRTLSNAVLYTALGLAILGAAIAAFPHVNMDAGAVVYGAAAVAGLLVLSSLWRGASRFVDYHFADSNVLLVTPQGAVRRLRGKVRVWPFSDFPDLQVVTMSRHTGTAIYHVPLRAVGLERLPDEVPTLLGGLESIHLNEPGGNFQHEIVDDGSFGPMEDIVAAIIARGRTQSS
jgi:hypothetical protein